MSSHARGRFEAVLRVRQADLHQLLDPFYRQVAVVAGAGQAPPEFARALILTLASHPVKLSRIKRMTMAEQS